MAVFNDANSFLKNAGEDWSYSRTANGVQRFEVRGDDYYDNPTVPAATDDEAQGKNRSEIVSRKYTQFERQFNLEFDVMVESGAANTADWLLLAQLHQSEDVDENGNLLDASASPPLALQLNGELMEIVGRANSDRFLPPSNLDELSYPPRIALNGQNTMYLDTNPIVRDQWYTMRFEIVFDHAEGGSGSLRVFRDGQLLVDYDGPLGYNDAVGPYLQLGVYRKEAPETTAARFRDITWEGVGTPDPFDGTPGDDDIQASEISFWEAEVLNGLGGNDTLNGGVGADTMNGGTGDDIYVVDDAGDVINEVSGTDQVQSFVSYTLGAGLENLILQASGDIDATGNAGINTLQGNTGNNLIRGLGGNDSLLGDLGNDTIEGGAGDDQAYGGGGADTLRGGTGNDELYGEAGNDSLSGEAGNDTLEGGAGADTMTGGAGDDTYVVDNTADVVNEAPGGGRDVVRSSVNFTAGSAAEIEVLNTTDQAATTAIDLVATDIDNELRGNDGSNTLVGRGGNDLILGFGGVDTLSGDAGTDTLFGGDGADLLNGWGDADNLLGEAGDDTLNGGSGNDTLNGGTGADLMEGGAGDDQYAVDNAGDRIVEAAGGGNDILRASASFALDDGAEVETIRTGDQNATTAIDLTGSRHDNTIAGNNGANRLDGRGGDDILFGYDGVDTLLGGAGGDVLYTGSGAGGRAEGGSGDDTYVVDAANTMIVEVAGGGNDTVRTSVTLELAATSEVEMIRVADQSTTTNIDLRGSDTDNQLRGNEGDNTLDGRAGADRMVGLGGDDTYIVDNAGDIVDERAGNGTDRILTDVTLQLSSVQEIETLAARDVSSTDNINLVGNDGNQTILGNAGNNLISGNGGNDTITPGDGNDTILGGDGTDTAVFAATSTEVGVAAGASSILLTLADGTKSVSDTVENFRFSDTTLSYAQVAALNGQVLTAPGGGADFPGTELANLMTGTTAAERFDARGGNDWINAGGGSDTVDGGAGRDMLSLYNVPDTPGRTNVQYRLEVDMGAGTSVSHDGAERITFSGIERFTASIYADRIRGSDGDDEIRGLGDYDWFIATRGNDSIDGGTGQDMISFLEYQSGAANVIGDIFGSNGLPPSGAQVSGLVVDLADPTNNTELAAGLELTSVERVTGSVRQDVFWGDDGQNDFRGLGDFDWFVSSEGGRERYFGGNGFDTVTYFNAASGIVASLSNGATVNGQETGFGDGGVARGDLYFEIENLVGSRFADRLTGSSERNQLNGLEGDDFIFGQGNTDYMKGGAGNDVIDGGDGADYALFSGNSADYTLTRAGNEVTVTGADGTDRLIDVEYFRFDNGDVTIWEL